MVSQDLNRRQDGLLESFGSFVIGAYAWAATVCFGAVLLDIVYYRLLPEAKAASSPIADLLLLLDALTIFIALGAIALSWNSAAARNLAVTSLMSIILGLFAPVVLSPLLQNAAGPWGPIIRLVISGLASGLALTAFYRFRRR